MTIGVSRVLVEALARQYGEIGIGNPRCIPHESLIRPAYNFVAYDFDIFRVYDDSGQERLERIGVYSVLVRGEEVISSTYSHKGPFAVTNSSRQVFDSPILVWSARRREDRYPIAFP